MASSWRPGTPKPWSVLLLHGALPSEWGCLSVWSCLDKGCHPPVPDPPSGSRSSSSTLRASGSLQSRGSGIRTRSLCTSASLPSGASSALELGVLTDCHRWGLWNTCHECTDWVSDSANGFPSLSTPLPAPGVQPALPPGESLREGHGGGPAGAVHRSAHWMCGVPTECSVPRWMTH